MAAAVPLIHRSFRAQAWCFAIALTLALGAFSLVPAVAVADPVFGGSYIRLRTGTSPGRVAIGDLNGDGRPELVVGNNSSRTLSILSNHGNAVFSSDSCCVVGPDPFGGVAVADFNRDGKLDVAAASAANNFATNIVTVLLGNGDGTLTYASTSPVGTTPNDIATGDFNGDTFPDVVTASEHTDSVSVLLGNGAGSFSPAIALATGGVIAYAVTVGDVNHDNKLDIAVANTTSGNASVLLGNGNGTFQAAATYGAGTSPVDVAFADVKIDGNPDLLVANYVSGTISILSGNGNGTFSAFGTVQTAPHPLAMAVADVNDDGKLDLVTISETNRTVVAHLGHGDGTFDAYQELGDDFNPTMLALGDVDGDGSPDVVTANSNQNDAALLLGNGDGSFGTGRFPKLATGDMPALVAIGDLNGDGLGDLAAINDQPSGTISVFLGAGGGTFSPKTDYAVGATPFSVAIADLNHDSKLDLIASNEGGGAGDVTVRLGAGDGTFPTRSDFSAGGDARFATVGMLNADANLDVVITNYLSSTVSVLIGNGSGGLNALAPTAAGTFPVDIAVADFDLDGKQDLAVANYATSHVSVLFGHGDGTFDSPAEKSVLGDSPYSVAAGDLNQDGKPDIATVTSAGISVLFGNGDRTFANAIGLGGGSVPSWIEIGDLNLDGKPDLVVANNGTRAIGALLGLGGGSFGPRTDYAGGFAPYAFAIGDVNGDGRPDIVTANIAEDSLSIMLGHKPPAFAGVPVIAAAGIQTSPRTVADGEGGAIVSWQDHGTCSADLARSSSPSLVLGPGHARIRLLVIDPTGHPKANWAAQGVTLACEAGDQINQAMVGDGAGGSLVVWQDDRNASYDLFAQHVSAAGVLAPGWPDSGVGVSLVTGDQQHVVATADGAGGIIVAWEDSRSVTNFDIYAQRITSSGAIAAGWPVGGRAVCVASGNQLLPTIVSDGAHGAIVSWQDHRGANEDVYAQRVNAAGVVQWAPNGVALCSASGDQIGPTSVSDDSGGVVVAWSDHRGADADIYLERVSSTGALVPGWTGDGVAFCTASGDQAAPRVISDGSAGAIVCWEDSRSGLALTGTGVDLYALRVLGTGVVSPGWTANGRQLCAASGDQHEPAMIADGAGGAIVTWQDERAGASAVFASQLTAQGTVDSRWPVNGLPLNPNAADQIAPVITTDGAGGAIVAWVDERGADQDIYASHLFDSSSPSPLTVPNEARPHTFRLMPARPNPTHSRASLTLDLAARARVSADIVDVAGRRVRALASDRAFEPGLHTLTWDGTSDSGRPLRAGVYWARVRVAGDVAVQRIVLLH